MLAFEWAELGTVTAHVNYLQTLRQHARAGGNTADVKGLAADLEAAARTRDGLVSKISESIVAAVLAGEPVPPAAPTG